MKSGSGGREQDGEDDPLVSVEKENVHVPEECVEYVKISYDLYAFLCCREEGKGKLSTVVSYSTHNLFQTISPSA